jgi:hypothetical protein
MEVYPFERHAFGNGSWDDLYLFGCAQAVLNFFCVLGHRGRRGSDQVSATKVAYLG